MRGNLRFAIMDCGGARCASWRLSSGLTVILLFLDDCGIPEHFGEECKKKILDSAFRGQPGSLVNTGP